MHVFYCSVLTIVSPTLRMFLWLVFNETYSTLALPTTPPKCHIFHHSNGTYTTQHVPYLFHYTHPSLPHSVLRSYLTISGAIVYWLLAGLAIRKYSLLNSIPDKRSTCSGLTKPDPFGSANGYPAFRRMPFRRTAFRRTSIRRMSSPNVNSPYGSTNSLLLISSYPEMTFGELTFGEIE